MSLPSVIVEAALSTRPTEAPVWTDLTPWVESFSVRRGRQTERDSMQAGTATVRLDNRDRRFDPSYTAGPYYGQLKRRRRMRLLAGQAYADRVLQDAPLGYWRLGEHGGTLARDSSGNGYDGTYVGSPTLDQTGAVPYDADRAVAFTTGQEVRVAHPPPDVTAFTIEAWVQFRAGSYTENRYVFERQAGAETSAYLWWETATNRWIGGYRDSGGTWRDYVYAPAAPGTTWHHVVLTADGGLVRWYWDGALVATLTQTGVPRASVAGDTLAIGNHRFLSQLAWQGALDEVAFYGTALPGDRVLAHYAAGRSTDPLRQPLYNGYVERWPQSLDGWGGNATVEVPLSDGLAVLATKTLTASYPQERSDLRVGRVLDAISWTTGQAWVLDSAVNSVLDSTTRLGPVGDRLLSEGLSQVQASTLAAVSAVRHLQDVEQTERGLLFLGTDGAVVFQGRRQRINPTSLATFGDRPEWGELPVREVRITDDTPLYNEVTVTRQGGVAQTVSDAASQADYFPVSLNVSNLLVTDSEALDDANARLGRYKQPRSPRISGLVLDGEGDPLRLWPHLLTREIGDCVTAQRRPPGDPSQAIAQVSWIEGVEHQYSAESGQWTVGWALSPADTDIYWVLDSPTASILDQTTRLAA